MAAKNLLFVDDEDSIRLTLPPLLKKHGFAVTAVGTIVDALAEINDRHYDVLVSDLNIEKPGDGFAVISAMRVFQPKCTNLDRVPRIRHSPAGNQICGCGLLR